jgi:hypothetical protein
MRENYADKLWQRKFEGPESADYFLLPLHYFGIASTSTSLLGYLVWLFLSPHRINPDAAPLDRTLGTFFLAQLVSCLLSSLFRLYNCTASFMTFFSMTDPGMVVLYGSFFGIQVLIQRYFMVRIVRTNIGLACTDNVCTSPVHTADLC